MANPNSAPEGRVQILPSFEDEAQAAKNYANYRINQLRLRYTATPELLDVSTPQKLQEHYEAADKEVEEAAKVALGASDGKVGTIGSLQGAATQGDYIQVRRRAKSLRHASRTRRLVHTVGRRQAFVRPKTGYVDARILDRVVQLLKSSMA